MLLQNLMLCLAAADEPALESMGEGRRDERGQMGRPGDGEPNCPPFVHPLNPESLVLSFSFSLAMPRDDDRGIKQPSPASQNSSRLVSALHRLNRALVYERMSFTRGRRGLQLGAASG